MRTVYVVLFMATAYLASSNPLFGQDQVAPEFRRGSTTVAWAAGEQVLPSAIPHGGTVKPGPIGLAFIEPVFSSPDTSNSSLINAMGVGSIAGAAAGLALDRSGALGNYPGPIANALLFAGLGAVAGAVWHGLTR